MLIEVEAFEGTLPTARQRLAQTVAAEALAFLSDAIRGVVMRVPAGNARTGAERPVSVVVVLRDGRRFDALATGQSVADAMETACHTLRLEVAEALGRSLRRRRQLEEGTLLAATDRRKSA